MIDTTEQNRWLKEWVKDDPDNLGTDLETRTFNALEVEMIMQIYSSEVVKNNVLLHNVSRRSEQLFCDCEIKGSSFQLVTGEICCCKCEKEIAK